MTLPSLTPRNTAATYLLMIPQFVVVETVPRLEAPGVNLVERNLLCRPRRRRRGVPFLAQQGGQPAAQAALVGTFGGHTGTSFSCRRTSAASFI